ncbi:MAG: response regulator, partial [Candidatus Cloacimonetes bacterium]|nr:response regulator [Candidatus Cloacimonadota bacterium]
MTRKRLLIVEDERFIAEDLKRILMQFDYNVIDIISYGEYVIERYEKLKPDLILMDIMLAGELNGIEVASKIKEKYNVPIIYLTAYANEPILNSAKVTEPFGYLIKPFEEHELHATIEMAFYRYEMEKNLRQSEKKYRLLFNSIADPIFIISENGKFFLDCNDVV